jgi:hypothetical protein
MPHTVNHTRATSDYELFQDRDCPPSRLRLIVFRTYSTLASSSYRKRCWRSSWASFRIALTDCSCRPISRPCSQSSSTSEASNWAMRLKLVTRWDSFSCRDRYICRLTRKITNDSKRPSRLSVRIAEALDFTPTEGVTAVSGQSLYRLHNDSATSFCLPRGSSCRMGIVLELEKGDCILGLAVRCGSTN